MDADVLVLLGFLPKRRRKRPTSRLFSFTYGSLIYRSIRVTAWYNVGMNAIQLFDRILDPVTDAFTPEVARRIVELKADAEMQSRIDELATKSSDGSLTEEEVVEYKSFVDVIDLISVLQAKSQRILNAAR